MSVFRTLAFLHTLTLVSHVVAVNGNYNISAASPGQTDVTDRLNGLLVGGGTKGVYKGGRGVVIRNINDGLTSVVVPCSFIVNDIIAPSTMYPDGNPECPNQGSSGYNKVGACSDKDDAFVRAVVGAVISDLGQLFQDGDKIQDDGWGYGVFYGTDSNSCDQRCRWSPDAKGYDCPGGWIPWGGTYYSVAGKKGSGNYASGNPDASLGGGGSGCHFSIYDKGIDQTDAVDNNKNLVKDENCQCNYDLSTNWWQDWVSQWMHHASPKKGFEWMGWFGAGKAPSFSLDMAACWVNNPRDMIMIQNAMWWFRDSWNNQLLPMPDGTGRRYWGWNEVPLDRAKVHNPVLWDAVVIKLPAVICGHAGSDDSVWCLSPAAQSRLEGSLSWHVAQKYLVPGRASVKTRPGSYILFLKEWWDNDAYAWYRGFYCESWVSPTGKYQTIYHPPKTKDYPTGVCYVEKGPPPKVCDKKIRGGCSCECQWTKRKGACDHDDKTCCWDCCCKHAGSASNQTDLSTVV